jgi:hypothetical protein
MVGIFLSSDEMRPTANDTLSYHPSLFLLLYIMFIRANIVKVKTILAKSNEHLLLVLEATAFV